MRRIIRGALAVVMTMAAIAIAPLSATAGTGTPSTSWKWGCVDGSYNGMRSWLSGDYEREIYLEATVAACAMNTADHIWAVAMYQSDGSTASRIMTTPQSYTPINTATFVHLQANTVAVCMLTGDDIRIDCVDVSGFDPNTLGPYPKIPVDDPRVDRPAGVDLKKWPGKGPTCPTCGD